jgi:thiol-disulfide isomerase/thioredoxin
MKHWIIFSVFALACCGSSTEKKRTDSDLLTYDQGVTVYEVSEKTKLADLMKLSHDRSKTPVLYFHAIWCGPCVAFKKSLTDNRIKSVFENAMLIGVDVDSNPEKLVEFYSIHSIPTFIKLDQDSNILAQITSGEWDEDIPANIAPVMDKFVNQATYDKK